MHFPAPSFGVVIFCSFPRPQVTFPDLWLSAETRSWGFSLKFGFLKKNVKRSKHSYYAAWLCHKDFGEDLGDCSYGNNSLSAGMMGWPNWMKPLYGALLAKALRSKILLHMLRATHLFNCFLRVFYTTALKKKQTPADALHTGGSGTLAKNWKNRPRNCMNWLLIETYSNYQGGRLHNTRLGIIRNIPRLPKSPYGADNKGRRSCDTPLFDQTVYVGVFDSDIIRRASCCQRGVPWFFCAVRQVENSFFK